MRLKERAALRLREEKTEAIAAAVVKWPASERSLTNKLWVSLSKEWSRR